MAIIVKDTDELEELVLTQGTHLQIIFSDIQIKQQKGSEAIGTHAELGRKEGFYISMEKPFWIAYGSNGSQGNWYTYLKDTRGFTYRQYIQTLCEATGAELEQAEDWQQQQEQYEEKKKRGSLLEEAHKYFKQALLQEEGAQVREYLQDRGYSMNLIESMDLGAHVDRSGLEAHLNSLGFSEHEIKGSGLFLETKGQALGKTHQLSILWRGRSGTPEGIGFRTILSSAEVEAQKWSKYLYSTGMKKSSSLVGFTQWRGKKSIILVEGLLDAQLISAYGLPAAGVGSARLSINQIKQLERSGVEEVYLALDQDQAGREGTYKALSSIRQHSKMLPFVVRLSSYKDPDEMIRAEGFEMFQAYAEDPALWASWLAEYVYDSEHVVSLADRERALHKALKTYVSISGTREARQFRERLLRLANITEDELDEKLRIYQQTQQEEQLKAQANTLIRELQQIEAGGDLTQLQEKLEEGIQKIKSAQGIEKPAPYSMDQFNQDLLSMSEGLSTGFKSFDEAAVRIPQGAITIVSGRPGHGKTTLMLNMLLNQVYSNPEKHFLFFSYEEAKQWIILKILMILAGKQIMKEGNQYAYINYLREKRGSEPAIERAYAELSDLLSSERLQIIDQSTHKLTGSELASMIAQISQEEPIGSIYVDYMQKIPMESASARYIEIKQASELILHEAVSRNISIIVGAQLNREARGKPQLNQLREGGDLEQDAHLVLGLYNASVDQQSEEEQLDTRSQVELAVSILKYRSGQAGREFKLNFNRPILRITD